MRASHQDRVAPCRIIFHVRSDEKIYPNLTDFILSAALGAMQAAFILAAAFDKETIIQTALQEKAQMQRIQSRWDNSLRNNYEYYKRRSFA